MTSGEQLPAGEPHADRLSWLYEKLNSNLGRVVLAAWIGVTGALAVGELSDSPLTLQSTEVPQHVENAAAYHSPEDAVDITPAETVIRVPSVATPNPVTVFRSTTSLPLETTSTTITTTTTLASETTTTTLVPPPPQSTTTTVIQDLSCRENIRQAFLRFKGPWPLGWILNCKPANPDFDGMTFPDRHTVEIYFRDINDSDNYMQGVVTHEYAHVIQNISGIANETLTDPATGQAVIDPATGVPQRRYSKEKLEEQADSFAWHFKYREKNKRGSDAGAIAVCTLFADHGYHLC